MMFKCPQKRISGWSQTGDGRERSLFAIVQGRLDQARRSHEPDFPFRVLTVNLQKAVPFSVRRRQEFMYKR